MRKLDDHKILMKTHKGFDQIYAKELDDHRILVKFTLNFGQNSADSLGK